MSDENRRPIEKAYVTKWALTQGILEVHNAEDYDGFLVKKERSEDLFISQKDWFLRLEDAQDRAEELKAARVKTLQKQLGKLQGYKPKIVIIE